MTFNPRMLAAANEYLRHIVDTHLPQEAWAGYGLADWELDSILESVIEDVILDLDALVRRDPAAHGEWLTVLGRRSGFEAVVSYRPAHAFYGFDGLPKDAREAVAGLIQKSAQDETKIEIQSPARIGKAFVLDHGSGTVIGEECVIGDDCYFLQSVTLGGTGIADNSGRRHPTIGNGVQIGGFARVYGHIHVGDGAIIGPYCVVAHGIPPGTRVTIVNQIQIERLPLRGSSMEVYGLVPGSAGEFTIYGRDMTGCKLQIVRVSDLLGTVEWPAAAGMSVEVLQTHADKVVARLLPIAHPDGSGAADRLGIYIVNGCSHTILTGCQGLRRAVEAGRAAIGGS